MPDPGKWCGSSGGEKCLASQPDDGNSDRHRDEPAHPQPIFAQILNGLQHTPGGGRRNGIEQAFKNENKSDSRYQFPHGCGAAGSEAVPGWAGAALPPTPGAVAPEGRFSLLKYFRKSESGLRTMLVPCPARL